MSQKDYQQLESELIGKIEECRVVVDGLKEYPPFKKVMSDFQKTVDMIDSCWHLTGELDKLTELRISKLAAVSVLRILDNYEHDLKKASEDLRKLRNQDTEVAKDYDPN